MGSPLRSPDSLSSLSQSLHHLNPQAHSILPAGSPISPQQHINSRAEFRRQGELCTHVDIATPPAGQPRGYTTPRIRHIASSSRLLPKSPKELLHGASGDDEEASRPHTVHGGARSEASRSSVGTSATALSAAHTLNASTSVSTAGGKRPATSASQMSGHSTTRGTSVGGHPRPPPTAQSARGGGDGRGRNLRLPKFACTMAWQRGTRVWKAYAESEWLTSPGRKLRTKLDETRQGQSYEEKYGGGRSSALPATWSPLPEPPEDRDPRDAFFRASKTTGLKYKPPNLASRIGVDKRAVGMNPQRVQLQYQGGEFVVPKTVWEPPEGIAGIYYRKKKKNKTEKLLGKHVLLRDAKKDGLRVVYSEQYYEIKKMSPEETRWKGTGAITEFDPDGLMTNVVWSDSSVEYCCTGYGGLYFLALADEDERPGKAGGKGGKAAKQGPDWKTEAQLAPKWSFGHKDGLFRVPFQPRHRSIKTLTDIAVEVKRLHLKLASDTPGTRTYHDLSREFELCVTLTCPMPLQVKRLHLKLASEMPGTRAYRDLSLEFELAKHELTELNRDRELMSRTIEISIGDKKFKIPPSALAPPAASALGTKKMSILQTIKKEVRREAEKQRRLTRLEEETEAERRKLERKAIRNKEYTEQIEHLERRSNLAKMDPWEAIRDAAPDVLNEILRETFTLFDLDGNGAMDAVEFEQALISMGVNAPPHLIQLVIADADRDKSGLLEFHEFKTLACSMVEAAKVQADIAKKRRKMEVLNARRAAAGANSVLIKPPDQALVEREKYVWKAQEKAKEIRKKGHIAGEAQANTFLFQSILGDKSSARSSAKIQVLPSAALPERRGSESSDDSERGGAGVSGRGLEISRRSSSPAKRMLPMPPTVDDITPHSDLEIISRTASASSSQRGDGPRAKGRDVILSLLESSVLGPKEKSSVQARRLFFTIERLSRRPTSKDASPERARSVSPSGGFGRTCSSSNGKGVWRSRSTGLYSSPRGARVPIEGRGKGSFVGKELRASPSPTDGWGGGAAGGLVRRKSADSGRGGGGMCGGAAPRRWSLVEHIGGLESLADMGEQERQMLLRRRIEELSSANKKREQLAGDTVGKSRRNSIF